MLAPPTADFVTRAIDSSFWDFGNRVLYPILGSKGLTISLGAKGAYEFLALEVFAGYFPEQMWLAFSLSNRG